MGAASISSGSSVVPISGEVVSREIDVPVTFTVSLAAPGTSMKLTVVIFATSTTTLVTLLRNPVASAATEYCPGMSPIAVNVPAEEVAVCDTTPVDVLVIAILAWLINAWLESVTVPLIPLCICACTGATRRSKARQTRTGRSAAFA